MTTRRGWVARLSGGRTASATQPPPSRPERGPMRPVRSGPPERTPLPGPRPRVGSAAPESQGPALRVVLVSRDKMLADALRSLIEAPGGVRMLDWLADELDGAIRLADVVIVDLPPNLHERTFALIDGRFLGRTVVLLQEGEHAEALPPGPPRVPCRPQLPPVRPSENAARPSLRSRWRCWRWRWSPSDRWRPRPSCRT